MKQQRTPIRDPRIIEYLPVSRIVRAEKISDPEFLIGREVIQPSERFMADEVITAEAGSSVLLDFGMELTGGVRIVTGRKGGNIRLVFGESVSEAMSSPEQWHTIHDAVLPLPSMGATEFGNTGFRFVRIDFADEVVLAGVMAAYRHRELKALGSFECSDERINRIWDVCVHTVSLNMQEYILDGVKRDRLVWMGDMHPEISVINHVYGQHEVVRKSLDYIRDRAKMPKFMNDISSYSLWWVICHLDIFMHFADLEYLREQHSYLRELMHLFGQYIDADGREILPETRFIDWPTKEDKAAVHAGLQALMVRGFASAARIAGFLGDDELENFCRAKHALLFKYQVPPVARKAPNALMALAGIADKELVNKEILSVEPCSDLGTFMGFYILTARMEAGDRSGVVDTIRKYYGAMLDYGATSFWEDFNMDWLENATPIDQPPVPGKRDLHADCGAFCYKSLRHSLCHGWAGGPAAVLLRMVSGIEILEPGFRKVRIKPNCAGFDYFKCTIPTPQGVIRIAMKNGENPRIELPKGVSLSL
ncbi:MAG: alpha-L-rhamnosidase [Lentisphaerae bacterium]|nr:alpha-L-rhamnosidase [Lentisphaerota bacterium]